MQLTFPLPSTIQSLSSMDEQPEASPWMTLPSELWTQIFCLVDDPSGLTLTCRFLHRIATDPGAVAQWLIRAHGRPLSLYRTLLLNKKVLTHSVALHLRRLGALIPRFLVQHVVKEQAEAVLGNAGARPFGAAVRPFPAALYALFIGEGYRLYGDEADFAGDDSSAIASAMFGDASLEQIRRLIVDFSFVPLRSLIMHPEEVVFRIAKIDISLIDHLLTNGWDPEEVNEGVMRRLVTASDVTPEMLGCYLDRGFTLTPRAIKAALRKCDIATLMALRVHVPQPELQEMVNEIFIDNLAPDFNFSITLVNFLNQNFTVPDCVIEKALVGQSSAQLQDFDKEDMMVAPRAEGGSADVGLVVPARTSSLPTCPLMLPTHLTRCFKQPKPGVAWRWVLQTYGPIHRFSQWCFDDSLLRMSHTDGGARPTAYDFLAAGACFRPRHARYLSAIAMGSSGFAVLAAHDLLQKMRIQVIDGGGHYLTTAYSPPNEIKAPHPNEQGANDQSPGQCDLLQERQMWCIAFQSEVERLRARPSAKAPEVGSEKATPVWAQRKASDPAFPAAWFLREMEGILDELTGGQVGPI
ncbi:hypothetical protein DFJ77DRAFT_454176 [Powellomyces hirtus]|nr:hypothetical protein DFJ77DRAFT_454176 [Powellomyces hirtus]